MNQNLEPTGFNPSKALQPTPLLSTEQAAAWLGVTKRFLEASRLKGGGPVYVRLSRNLVRYRLEDLQEWVQERIRENTSQD